MLLPDQRLCRRSAQIEERQGFECAPRTLRERGLVYATVLQQSCLFLPSPSLSRSVSTSKSSGSALPVRAERELVAAGDFGNLEVAVLVPVLVVLVVLFLEFVDLTIGVQSNELSPPRGVILRSRLQQNLGVEPLDIAIASSQPLKKCPGG